MDPIQTAAKIDQSHESLIREVLPSRFGREVVEITRLSGGTNVFSYLISIGEKIAPRVPTPLPGTSPLPATTSELIMRISDADSMLNEAVRVQSEVAAMTLAREALASYPSPIVPAVYAWEGSVLASDQSQHLLTPGWVLSESLPGSMLSDKWDSLGSGAKREVLEQIATIFQKLQAYKLPDSIKGYGGLNFDSDGNVIVGPTPIWGGGPCATYTELYTEYLQTQLAFAHKCDVVNGWNGCGLLPRIMKFAKEGLKPLLLQIESESKLRPTFVHADFDLNNIKIDEERNRVTALLDYDFAHIASQCDEYFYSFLSIGGLVGEPVMNHAGLMALQQSLLHGFTAKDAKRTDRFPDWKVAVMLDEEFAKAGVERPQDIPGIGQLSALYWFIQHVSPPEFFVKRWRTGKSPQEVERVKQGIQKKLEKYLIGWGF